MDWEECVKKRIVKDVKKDKNLMGSIKEIAEIKIKSAKILPKHLVVSKITLLYDALRGYLEALTLENGYKIYNHECYAAFLKEILNKPKEAEEFNKLRKIRNAINYYGRKVNKEEAEEIIKNLLHLIEKIKNLID